jgi:hypothetical protein
VLGSARRVAGRDDCIDAAVEDTRRRRSGALRRISVYLVEWARAREHIPVRRLSATLDLHDSRDRDGFRASGSANPVGQSAFMYWIPLPGLDLAAFASLLAGDPPRPHSVSRLARFELVFALRVSREPRHAG